MKSLIRNSKIRELVRYVIFGALTTVVGVGSYALLLWLFRIPDGDKTGVQVCNVISWILAVVFAYVVNKIFVFEKKTHGFRATALEFGGFVVSRLVSLGVESGGLFLLVALKVDNFIAKCITSVIVVILNYVFGKLIVFRKKK